jgi:hypothetical protein
LFVSFIVGSGCGNWFLPAEKFFKIRHENEI